VLVPGGLIVIVEPNNLVANLTKHSVLSYCLSWRRR
jgi:hypothetical protein